LNKAGVLTGFGDFPAGVIGRRKGWILTGFGQDYGRD
jgi:hypothetical protein